jgi:hypothetical protein
MYMVVRSDTRGVCMYVYIDIYTRIYINTYTLGEYICMYIYTYTYTHIYN